VIQNQSRQQERNLQAQWKNKFGPGGPLALRSAFFHPWSGLIDWLLQSDQKPLKPQKRFVKNPLSPPALGQNKTLKLCQNNVVINTIS
jgi:hypothetical protein